MGLSMPHNILKIANSLLPKKKEEEKKANSLQKECDGPKCKRHVTSTIANLNVNSFVNYCVVWNVNTQSKESN